MSNKRVILYGILLATMLIVILSGIGIVWVHQADDAPSSPTGNGAVFVVSQLNGRLAVFRQGEEMPVQWYEEVWISSFPEEEQRRLATGIRVSTAAELAAVLEDYTA